MHLKTIKSICLSFLALLIISYPKTIDALSHKWIAVGSNEFNEFKNSISEWKDPNGDKLILGVIDQVYFFSINS